jgi:glycosyltransferase involved in cell wall biosynthesis
MSQMSSAPTRIVIIGPTPPYRGGIVKYTNALGKAFEARGFAPEVFGFSRRYPSWLYPGAVDSEEETDTDLVVQRSIDWLNPFTWWATASKIAALKPRMVLVNWWTAFWAPSYWVILSLLNWRSVRFILICHNLRDHDSGWLKAWMAARVISISNAYVVHSSEDYRALRSSEGPKEILVHPHPVHLHCDAPRENLPKRGRLELLFFGFVRPYKGLEILLSAMEQLRDREVYLTVVGENWSADPGRLLALASRSNTELVLRYVSDSEAAAYFTRTDYLVLPYLTATGSAVASLALHHSTPIIASKVGGLPDVVLEGVTGKLVIPGDVGSLAEAIRTTDRVEAVNLASGVARFRQRISWQSMCEALLAVDVK